MLDLFQSDMMLRIVSLVTLVTFFLKTFISLIRGDFTMSKYAQLFDNFEKSYKVLKTGIVEELPEKIDLQAKIDSEVPNCLSVLLDKYLALDGAENFLSPVTDLSEEDTEALVEFCGSCKAERMLLVQNRLDNVRDLLKIPEEVPYSELIKTIQKLKIAKKEVTPDVQNPSEPKSE